MDIQTCSEPTCGKQFVFLNSVRQPGKFVPVDVASVTQAEMAGEGVDFESGRHVSHYSTCTNPKAFSKQLHSKGGPSAA